MIFLKPFNKLMMTSVTKNFTLSMNFHGPVGESNKYEQFGYSPQTI